MKIECFPVLMSEEDAMKRARSGIAGLYGRKKKVTLRLMWLENRYLEFDMTYQDSILRKWLKPDKNKVDRQKIRALVEATTCSACYVPDAIHTELREVEENDIQATYYPDDRLIYTGRECVRRMVTRHAGRHVIAELAEMRKVYRPFYIAIYGEMIEGTKARYLPIPADGNEINRTF